MTLAEWAGIHRGVRGPTQDETPLSAAEVAFADMKGLI